MASRCSLAGEVADGDLVEAAVEGLLRLPQRAAQAAGMPQRAHRLVAVHDLFVSLEAPDHATHGHVHGALGEAHPAVPATNRVQQVEVLQSPV
jgi:hypothetical protein